MPDAAKRGRLEESAMRGRGYEDKSKDTGSPIKDVGDDSKRQKRRHWIPAFARMTETEEADSSLRSE